MGVVRAARQLQDGRSQSWDPGGSSCLRAARTAENLPEAPLSVEPGGDGMPCPSAIHIPAPQPPLALSTGPTGLKRRVHPQAHALCRNQRLDTEQSRVCQGLVLKCLEIA